MWTFFSARLRMWLILAIAAPVLGWLLGKVGDLVEARRGPSWLSRALRQVSGWLGRHTTGPLAARRQADPASVRDVGAPAR